MFFSYGYQGIEKSDGTIPVFYTALKALGPIVILIGIGILISGLLVQEKKAVNGYEKTTSKDRNDVSPPVPPSPILSTSEPPPVSKPSSIEKSSVPPPPSSLPSYNCHYCNMPLRFIMQYQRWYCDSCQRYI